MILAEWFRLPRRGARLAAEHQVPRHGLRRRGLHQGDGLLAALRLALQHLARVRPRTLEYPFVRETKGVLNGY